MNTITANAPLVSYRQRPSLSATAEKLGNFLAASDPTGNGNWSEDSKIPWQAWPAAIAFPTLFVLGWDLLA